MDFKDFFRVTPRSRKVKLKHKKGVLFKNPGLLGKTIFYAGSWLFVLALTYAIYLYFPLVRTVLRYELVTKKNSSSANLTTIVPTPTPLAQSEQKQEYNITIPKIGAFADIAENVDPFNRNEYLKVLGNNFVAQAKDSSNPGLGKGHTTYLFAHSTTEGLDMLRKNSIFYLLGELGNGDVIFINKNGINYTYKVYKQQVVDASQIQYLKYTEADREVLILQTCWPIGTDWKRLLVFAELVR